MATQVSSKTSLSPTMRRMREKGLQSLDYFTQEIMRYGSGTYRMNSAIHHEFADWFQGVFDDPRMFQLFLDFRGSGKSLIGGVSHTLWRCIRNPNITIRYMHADESMASEIMSQIRGHLEANETFRALYQDEITPKITIPASDDSFTLNRTYAPRTPTLKMLGYKTGRIGTHVDLFVLDDLVNNKTTSSQLLMEGVKDFIRQLPPLLNDQNGIKSKVLGLGTRWDIDEAWGMLEDSEEYRASTRVHRKSCFADPQETISRWPEKYTADDFRRIEVKMTTPLFSANYRNDPVPRGSQLFDVEKVKRYEIRLDSEQRPVLPEKQPYLIYTAVDPNRKDDGTGDPAAVLTVARDGDGNHFVLDLDYGRPNSIELVQWVRQAVQKWHPLAVLYEAICGQEILIPWLKQDMVQSGVIYNLVPSNRKNTATTKGMRIRALSSIIETGRLWVPESVRFKPLLREIELYTGQAKQPKDDCLDCLADIYGDGVNPAGGRRKRASERVDMPWQSSTLDSMIAAGGTYGIRKPRVVSIESAGARWR